MNDHVFGCVPTGKEFSNQPQYFVRDLRNEAIIHLDYNFAGWNKKDFIIHESNTVHKIERKFIKKIEKDMMGENIPSPSNILTIGTSIILYCIYLDIVPSLFGIDLDINDENRTHYWETRPNQSVCHNVSGEKVFLNYLFKEEKIKIYK